MAFGWRAKTETTSGFTLTEPAGAAEGDLLIVVWQYRGQGAMTAPAGWGPGLFFDDWNDHDLGPRSQRIWWRRRGATAPNLTWTDNANTFGQCGSMYAYSVSEGAPYLVTSVQSTTTAQTAGTSIGAVTTTRDGQLIFAAGCNADRSPDEYDATSGPTIVSGSTLESTAALSETTWQLRMLVSHPIEWVRGSAADALMATAGTTTITYDPSGAAVPTIGMALVFGEAKSRSQAIIIH